MSMWPRIALLSLTLLAACEPAGDACVCEEATYSVNALVSLNEEPTATKASTNAGRVLASVSESSSVVGCGDGLTTQVSPGRHLVSNQPVFVDAGGFTLRFSSSTYPELDSPALSLEVLLDENANGRCDDGEPSAQVPLERSLRSRVQVALMRSPCPVRL
jgi:hypothetical protein